MSSFIIPIGNLPSISSLQGVGGAQSQQPVGGSSIPFADMLQNAIQNVEGMSEVNQGSIMDLAMGQSDDLHTGSIDALKSSVAVNFASNLTSSAIRAYNELMRMQI